MSDDLKRLHAQLAPLAALQAGERADRLRHGRDCRLSYSMINRHKITVHECVCGVATLDHFITTGEVRSDD